MATAAKNSGGFVIVQVERIAEKGTLNARDVKILDFMTLTAEPGVIGGLPAGGLNFGAATNTDALEKRKLEPHIYETREEAGNALTGE